MAFDTATLDAPFTALAAYEWGADAAPFAAIDRAVIAAHADAALRADLEKRLAAILGSGPSRAAKEYACRKLMMIGTTASVPALAALLGDRDNSHMARFALERIDAPEAGAALRAALGTVPGDLKIGMISSLAARRDTACVGALATLLAGDAATAIAAAEALGTIATPEAFAALSPLDPTPANGLGRAVADARLAYAEALLAAGKRAEAQAVYRALADAARGKPAAKTVELAATRGILACLDTSTAGT
jgi:hypothetical protein